MNNADRNARITAEADRRGDQDSIAMSLPLSQNNDAQHHQQDQEYQQYLLLAPLDRQREITMDHRSATGASEALSNGSVGSVSRFGHDFDDLLVEAADSISTVDDVHAEPAH